VARIASIPLVMEVNPSVPAKTVPEFIAYAKANPGKINMASAGVGAPSHVIGELFKMMTSVNLVHIAYRGSPPALTDLLSGQVQLYFATTTASIAYIRAGTLRALREALPKYRRHIERARRSGPRCGGCRTWGQAAPVAERGNLKAPEVTQLNYRLTAKLHKAKVCDDRIAARAPRAATPLPRRREA